MHGHHQLVVPVLQQYSQCGFQVRQSEYDPKLPCGSLVLRKVCCTLRCPQHMLLCAEGAQCSKALTRRAARSSSSLYSPATACCVTGSLKPKYRGPAVAQQSSATLPTLARLQLLLGETQAPSHVQAEMSLGGHKAPVVECTPSLRSRIAAAVLEPSRDLPEMRCPVPCAMHAAVQGAVGVAPSKSRPDLWSRTCTPGRQGQLMPYILNTRVLWESHPPQPLFSHLPVRHTSITWACSCCLASLRCVTVVSARPHNWRADGHPTGPECHAS